MMDTFEQFTHATINSQWLRIQTRHKAIIARPLQVGQIGINRNVADCLVEYRNGMKIERVYLDEVICLQLHKHEVGDEMKDTLNKLAGSFVGKYTRWK